MNDEMLDPANDPANWDCCDEHDTVFWKGTPCPKCEPEPDDPTDPQETPQERYPWMSEEELQE